MTSAFSLRPSAFGRSMIARRSRSPRSPARRRSSRSRRPAPQVPRPSFETKAEIVLVDVNVVDRDARPVPTLTPADFELEVNGQPRKIESVQFISTAPTNVAPATPRESALHVERKRDHRPPAAVRRR